MSTKSAEVLTDPIFKNVDGDRIVRIQNVKSKLWVYALTDSKIVSHSDSGTTDPKQQWKLTLTDSVTHRYLIQNVGTKNYAWVSEPPKSGDEVIQKPEGTREWTIVPADTTQFKISPTGASDNLCWTQAEVDEGKPIQVMEYQSDKSLWIFHEVNTPI
ncbi:hypothetical protein BDY19DRAFT_117563 [Irpex rosettiformis]|uniref:Uncharacterized protein n=1 Tax=Irpex rosettiformis TaxID=378272 RepID=A0ACB8U5Q5_9APHY|nr:hypothetical protein BDY19DRAFT_117563 [Irpex rosettiformis]